MMPLARYCAVLDLWARECLETGNIAEEAAASVLFETASRKSQAASIVIGFGREAKRP